jgi:hypothetical protein
MKYEVSKNLSVLEFKQLFGVTRETFTQIPELIKQAESNKLR